MSYFLLFENRHKAFDVYDYSINYFENEWIRLYFLIYRQDLQDLLKKNFSPVERLSRRVACFYWIVISRSNKKKCLCALCASVVNLKLKWNAWALRYPKEVS
jgi:hypothetical protein